VILRKADASGHRLSFSIGGMEPFNAVTAVFAGLIFMIATSLPKVGDPGIVPLGALTVGFGFAAFARAKRLPREEIRRYIEDGAFYGAALGFIMYFAALLTSV
jgi:hypothetical protein